MKSPINRIGVVGSRELSREFVFSVLDAELGDYDNIVILSGGARGTDTYSKEWAKEKGVPHIEFRPYHLLDSSVDYTPRHFFVRNKQIVDNADLVIACWNGRSKGTESVIKLAKKRRVPLALHIDESSSEE